MRINVSICFSPLFPPWAPKTLPSKRVCRPWRKASCGARSAPADPPLGSRSGFWRILGACLPLLGFLHFTNNKSIPPRTYKVDWEVCSSRVFPVLYSENLSGLKQRFMQEALGAQELWHVLTLPKGGVHNGARRALSEEGSNCRARPRHAPLQGGPLSSTVGLRRCPATTIRTLADLTTCLLARMLHLRHLLGVQVGALQGLAHTKRRPGLSQRARIQDRSQPPSVGLHEDSPLKWVR